jgi:hypothetical protein
VHEMDETTVVETTERPAPTSGAEPATGAPGPDVKSGDRADSNWSRPVDRLAMGAVPSSAININVDGRRLVGPVQGFGQLWQKRYEIRLAGADVTPEAVVATWKAEFGSFWPKGNRFYGPVTSLAPGEVALLNLDVPGRQTLSTGVMVIYADEESFTFMTPEGHMFAAWITFTAMREDGVIVPRIEVLLRANDPLYEVSMRLFLNKQENAFWMATLRNLAARFGVDAQATVDQTCVDRRRQWNHAGNIRHNAAIRSGLYRMTHPRIWFGHPDAT